MHHGWNESGRLVQTTHRTIDRLCSNLVRSHTLSVFAVSERPIAKKATRARANETGPDRLRTLPVRSLIVIGLPNRSTWGGTVRAIGQRWRWLVGAALLGAAIGVVSTFFRPVLYEGITTLLVLPPPTAPTAPINPATFRAILVNGSIALQVITELKLDAPPHNLTPQSFIENAVDFEQLAGTNVLRVRVSLRTPELAAEASRSLAQKAVALTQDLNQQERAAAQELLGNRRAEALESMNNAEKAMLAYQQQAQVELIKADVQAMLNERSGLLKLTIDIESEKARLQAAEQRNQAPGACSQCWPVHRRGTGPSARE